MNVAVAAISRFHLFQMAAQLQEQDLLCRLITAYPKYKCVGEFGIKGGVVSLPYFAVWRELVVRLERTSISKASSAARHQLHRKFSQAVAANIGSPTNVVIGLASYMKDVQPRAKDAGVVSIVDHGSLHEKTERKILEEECDKFGFREFGNWSQSWLVDRMDWEFDACDHVLCCSALAKQTLVSHGVRESKIFANPLGVDLRRFAQNEDAHDVSRPFRVICVSNNSPRKGVHYLVEGFIKARLPNSELWIVGSYPSDPVLSKLLSTAARRHSNISLKGPFPENQLPSLYKQCSVFALPSLCDGWAMVVLQAMAAGLPVVVSTMTGAKEVVKPESGFVIPPQDSDSIAYSLSQLYESPELAKQMGLLASQTVRHNYTWSAYGSRLCSWLHGLARDT